MKATMKANEPVQAEGKITARHMIALLLFLPLFNSTAAAAMGFFVVYSDADDYKFLAGVLSAANVGGWLWWLSASWKQLKLGVEKWMSSQQAMHPGYRLASLMSLSLAVCWIGVLCLLAYGMLG